MIFPGRGKGFILFYKDLKLYQRKVIILSITTTSSYIFEITNV